MRLTVEMVWVIMVESRPILSHLYFTEIPVGRKYSGISQFGDSLQLAGNCSILPNVHYCVRSNLIKSKCKCI